MKHWQETAAIFEEIAAGGDSPARQALATVVGISGSAYRRPGARLLIPEQGATLGGVSGGCLEADVREIALQVLRSGAARLRHYDTGAGGDTVWGLGLGCEGAVDVLVQPVDAAFRGRVGSRVRELMAAAAPFALATTLAGPRMGRTIVWGRGSRTGSTGDPDLDTTLEREAAAMVERGAGGRVAQGPSSAFIEVLTPPPHLVVFGAGDDALPLVRLAIQVGFDVTVVDHRAGYLTPERLPPPVRRVLRRSEEGLAGMELGPRHHAVVQTHSLVHDRDWVAMLLRSPIAYLGLLGPRARREELLEELGARPGDRLYAPVGLDIGADGPEQVAVSIVAELLAVHSGRSARHLRDRVEAIHAS